MELATSKEHLAISQETHVRYNVLPLSRYVVRQLQCPFGGLHVVLVECVGKILTRLLRRRYNVHATKPTADSMAEATFSRWNSVIDKT